MARRGEQLPTATQYEIIDFTIKALISGNHRRDIVKYIKEKYNVSETTSDNYIARAKVKIHEMANENKDVQFALSKSVMRLEDLYKRNLKNENLPECRAVINELNKLIGINAPTKVEVSGKDGGAIQTENKTTILYEKLSDSTLQELINASTETT